LKSWPHHDGDVFDKDNGLAYIKQADALDFKETVSSPRVGLTLKRYDAEKEQYWMADYRFHILPEKCKKMNVSIQVALLGKGMSPLEVQNKLATK